MVLDALAQRQAGHSIEDIVLAMRCFDDVQEPIIFNEFGEMKRSPRITVARDSQFMLVE